MAVGDDLPERALERLDGILRGLGSCLVAFSGGVDSTLLLAAAARALPGRVVAATVRSLLHDPEEAEDARRRAGRLGVAHEVLEADLAGCPEILGNPPDRCYHCKRRIFALLRERATALGLAVVVDATHAGDLGERRPGLRALRELGVRSPLAEAGMGKAAVRALSAHLGLEGADRPSNPCLATRIPYGTALTAARLGRVREAERALGGLGFAGLRVRDHGDVARLELPAADLERAVAPALRAAIVERLRELGFGYVTLDLAGYRSGSMDEALPRGGA